MYNGEISCNTALKGGGLYLYANNSNFTMYGGEISGNIATGSGGGAFRGGGTFRIVTGTIYGNDFADESLRNTATEGASVYMAGSGYINYGTFSGTGGAWVNTGNLGTPNAGIDNTIKVENGVLVLP
jgi:hypothetical protein